MLRQGHSLNRIGKPAIRDLSADWQRLAGGEVADGSRFPGWLLHPIRSPPQHLVMGVTYMYRSSCIHCAPAVPRCPHGESFFHSHVNLPSTLCSRRPKQYPREILPHLDGAMYDIGTCSSLPYRNAHPYSDQARASLPLRVSCISRVC